MTPAELEREVLAVVADPALTKGDRAQAAGRLVMEALDRGEIRVASPESRASADAPSRWTVHAWVKQGILLFVQNETESLFLLLTLRTKTMRVIVFRAGPSQGKRMDVLELD